MSEHLSATFTVASWDEERTVDTERGGISLAQVKQDLSGGIDGSGLAQWLMCYREDKTADFVGLQRVEGSVDGREGSFVLTSNGDFDGKRAAGRMEVVAGSGTGELEGISGTGTFDAPLGSEASVELDYELS